jgi:hypothetical protein
MLARDLEARVLRREREQTGRLDTGRLHRGYGGFLDEARALLGTRHPLTSRLELKYVLLGAGSGGTAELERAVRTAAATLGDGHPAVMDARAVLAAWAALPSAPHARNGRPSGRPGQA